MNKTERNQAIQKIQSDVEEIKRDVALIIQHLLKKDEPNPIPPYVPYPRDSIPTPPTKCSKCGLELNRVMGYVCSDQHCPTFMRPWCGTKIVTTGYTPWQSYNEETKE
jgi:hypothetical protein